MTYTINRAAVAKLLYGKTYYPDMIPIYHELNFRAGQVAASARAKVGTHTGRLRSSIAVDGQARPPYWWFRIEGHTSYAYYHHRGTKPHIITGSLAFRKGGKMVHASVVHHPGTRPNPFLSDSLRTFMIVRETAKYHALDRAMAARYS